MQCRSFQQARSCNTNIFSNYESKRFGRQGRTTRSRPSLDDRRVIFLELDFEVTSDGSGPPVRQDTEEQLTLISSSESFSGHFSKLYVFHWTINKLLSMCREVVIDLLLVLPACLRD